MRNIIDGLTILLALHKPDQITGVSAEHDMLYASGPPPEEIPEDVLKKLEELHWFWDEGLDSWTKNV